MYYETAEKLLEFIRKSPTAFHAVDTMKKTLAGHGFQELSEKELWSLTPGGNYMVTRNNSALIAFSIPEKAPYSFHIMASHSDSPCFKIKENPEMTAVFITNYEMTMGAVIGLNELGIRIPEEISLVGFDNLPFARACNPKLTIVSQPTDKIAEAAAGIMLERLEHAGNESGCRTEKLGTTIIHGKSIAQL